MPLSNSAYASRLASIVLLAGAAALVGCSSDVGPTGPAGQPGAAGRDGVDGTDGTDGTKGADGAPGESFVVDQSLSPLEKAFVGVGGKDNLLALSGLTIESKGARWVLGEGQDPADPAVEVSTFDVTVVADLAGKGLRIDYKRHIDVLGLVADTKFSEIISGDLAYIAGSESLFGAPGDTALLSDRMASIRKQQVILNPQILLKQAAEDPTFVLDDKGVAMLDGAVHHLVVVNTSVSPTTLWVNHATGWVDKVSFIENEPLHRDVEVEVLYYGWSAASSGGLRFPSDLYIALDGQIIHQEGRSLFAVNPVIAPDAFDIPAGMGGVYDKDEAARGEASHQFHQMFASFGIPLDGEQTFVQPVQLKPGVWHVTGGSHHSLVVEQDNGLVLVDAPLDEARQDAILAWTTSQFPNKPLAHVVLTHHHSDHTGGIRTIAATGADVIVSAVSGDYFREIFHANSTVVPDALAMKPVVVKVIPVDIGGTYELLDTLNTVRAYHIDVNHAKDMLMVYVPGAEVVFNADLLNPGTPLFIPPPFIPNGKGLYDGIMAAGINSPTLIMAGGHGSGTNTFAELSAALGVP